MITVVIPARMASSRYPGKPLVPILGIPLVEHVRRRALLSPGIKEVVIATCDSDIKEAVEKFGGRAIMTRDTHERCTDRVTEAMQHLSGDIVVMVQGDEPLLNPDAITQVSQPLINEPALEAVNLLSPLESGADYGNINIVKAACNLAGNVLFLTRAPIPCFRKQEAVPVYRQTGIMAFRTAFLRRYSSMSITPLERVESIDMLRIIEHGITLRGVIADYTTIGVDRPEDVPMVETALSTDPVQIKLYEQTHSPQERT